MVSVENKRVEDMNYFELLAWLGIGSSHPGGFPATKLNLATVQIKSEEYVLDAGCGSGLTACHLAKTTGCRIIGIDISPQMIEKATQRAEKEGVSHLVEFRVADVTRLPFSENSFDWVIAESITVFLDKVHVYQEFYRVLKPEGQVADLEMALIHELPAPLKHQLAECFGPSTKPLSFEGWCQSITEAGFQNVEIKNPQPLKNNGNLIASELKKDWILIKDLADKVSKQPGLIPRLQKNVNFTRRTQGYFGFGLIYGRKPTPPALPVPQQLSFKRWLLNLLQVKQAK